MEQNKLNDAELVASTRAGNREAFGELYDRYARRVRAVTAGVSGDWNAVEDLTQESFLRAYRNLARLRDPERFGAWIVGIARLVARERRRFLMRDRHEFGEAPIQQIEAAANTESSIEDREQIELLMRRMASLPEKERIAIHGFFLEQQDAPRGAEMLGYSRSGFYSLIQRGIARLAASMQPCSKNTKR